MIGQLQTVPGAAVFTFDYHDQSGDWVDDATIGPRLGAAIDCLFTASGQEQVIVVGHSMGGLATRFALGQEDPSRADKVSTVVTLGTPNTGSMIARLVATGRDALPPAMQSVLRPLMALCGVVSTASVNDAGLCSGPVGAFDGAAGQALRTGSPEFAALAPWPDQVDVHALGVMRP